MATNPTIVPLSLRPCKSEPSAHLLQINTLRERINLRRECIAALHELYAESFPSEYMLAHAQFYDWMTRYEFSVVVEAIEITAAMFHRWARQSEEMEAVRKTKFAIVRYASAVMRNKVLSEAKLVRPKSQPRLITTVN